MEAKRALRDYTRDRGIKKITNTDDLRQYLEGRFSRVMPRKLFVSVGKGGGQYYKILFSVVDPAGNFNKACYFYSEVPDAVSYLRAQGHIELQDWLDSSETGR